MNSSFLHSPILLVVLLYNLEWLFMCWAFVHSMAWSWRALCPGYLGSWSSVPTSVYWILCDGDKSPPPTPPQRPHPPAWTHQVSACPQLISTQGRPWATGISWASWGSKEWECHILDLSSFHHLPLGSKIFIVGTLAHCTLNVMWARDPLLPLCWDLSPGNSVITLHLTLCEPTQLNSQKGDQSLVHELYVFLLHPVWW